MTGLVIWCIGAMFTSSFLPEKDSYKWWAGVVLFLFWPAYLGAFLDIYMQRIIHILREIAHKKEG